MTIPMITSRAAMLAMALTLAACGSGGSEGQDGAGEPAPGGASPAQEQAQARIEPQAHDGSAQPAAFAQCVACHRVEADAPPGIGPHLVGVVGAPAASRGDFQYSPALRNSGIVWNEEQLDAFLTNPQKVVPGTMMAFGGIADPEQRRQIIDYLATLK